MEYSKLGHSEPSPRWEEKGKDTGQSENRSGIWILCGIFSPGQSSLRPAMMGTLFWQLGEWLGWMLPCHVEFDNEPNFQLASGKKSRV